MSTTVPDFCPTRVLDWHDDPTVSSEEDFAAEPDYQLSDLAFFPSTSGHKGIVVGRIVPEAQQVADERAAAQTLEQRFNEQSERWRMETSHLSSPLQMMGHPSYQAIMGMAAESQEAKRLVIRLMLSDLLKDRNDWYLALSYLTHENPIHRRDYGKPSKIREAWINWGRSQGLL